LLTSYDKEKHQTQKISIRVGNNVSVIGSGDVDVPNGVLEDVFHVHEMPINLLFVYRACKKGYKFEAWHDIYVPKHIDQGFKIVSFDPVDNGASLYKFVDFFLSRNNLSIYMLHM